MEHHHFDQCVMILNSSGNQILANLSPDEYSRVIKVLEEAILSTDLAVYFRYVSYLQNISCWCNGILFVVDNLKVKTTKYDVACATYAH